MQASEQVYVLLCFLAGLSIGRVIAYIESKYKCDDKLMLVTHIPCDFQVGDTYGDYVVTRIKSRTSTTEVYGKLNTN